MTLISEIANYALYTQQLSPNCITASKTTQHIDMRLLHLNCQSLNTCRQQLSTYVDTKDVKIMCLSETWFKGTEGSFRNWRAYVRNRPAGSDGYGGVAIFIHPSIKTIPFKLDSDMEAVWCKVVIENKVVILGSVYIPPGKIDHIAKLDQILQNNVPDNTPVVVAGDVNAVSSMWDSKPNISQNSMSYQMGLEVEGLIATHGFHIHNTGHYTYIKKNDTTGVVTK